MPNSDGNLPNARHPRCTCLEFPSICGGRFRARGCGREVKRKDDDDLIMPHWAREYHPLQLSALATELQVCLLLVHLFTYNRRSYLN